MDAESTTGMHTSGTAEDEIANGQRFAFGENWQQYRNVVNDGVIEAAKDDLREKLDVSTLAGRTFLDIGCGSGIHSLVAYQLGASVVSIDFDPDSIASTQAIRSDYAPEAGARWTVRQGSVLDRSFLAKLPPADIVYSWGVLHHTGSMWEAISNVCDLVPVDGCLFIAIYNDQGGGSLS